LREGGGMDGTSFSSNVAFIVVEALLKTGTPCKRGEFVCGGGAGRGGGSRRGRGRRERFVWSGSWAGLIFIVSFQC